MLQFFLGTLEGAGHAIDARGQFIELGTAQRGQAFFQVAVLELGHGFLYLADRVIDRAAHSHGQQRRGHQAQADQQQAGKQAAIAPQ
ncbi:hypothetical protein D3C75_1302850 [compost metagenome]